MAKVLNRYLTKEEIQKTNKQDAFVKRLKFYYNLCFFEF